MRRGGDTAGGGGLGAGRTWMLGARWDGVGVCGGGSAGGGASHRGRNWKEAALPSMLRMGLPATWNFRDSWKIGV